MNTQFSSELFSLHDALNNPITYQDSKKKRVAANSAKATANPFSWLPKVLAWLNANIFRTGRALHSA